jgi:hypothetical protein
MQATAYETMGGAIIYTYDHRADDGSTGTVRWEHKWGSSITIRLDYVAVGRWAA